MTTTSKISHLEKELQEVLLKKEIKDIINEVGEKIKSQAAPNMDKLADKNSINRTHLLFHGEHKTGKTLAAALLGKHSGREVHRVDLSRVISKYIGETEKNLRLLFSHAEDKNWILFFDEADALFGKRTDVKDSHDRYANVEVSHLLQRIEDYKGTVILAVNKKSSIDDAFLRRLHFVVDFPIPDSSSH